MHHFYYQSKQFITFDGKSLGGGFLHLQDTEKRFTELSKPRCNSSLFMVVISPRIAGISSSIVCKRFVFAHSLKQWYSTWGTRISGVRKDMSGVGKIKKK
jgi:hypothetical protein